MKLFVGFVVFVWLLCGLVGGWWGGNKSWKAIAKGPITLIHAFNENPVTYPGPN